jgi:hypothetical protein
MNELLPILNLTKIKKGEITCESKHKACLQGKIYKEKLLDFSKQKLALKVCQNE